jgi:hypothetical protein
MKVFKIFTLYIVYAYKKQTTFLFEDGCLLTHRPDDGGSKAL